MARCNTCRGTGQGKCQKCEGLGKMEKLVPRFGWVMRSCNRCNGNKRDPHAPCPDCEKSRKAAQSES